MRTIHVPFSRVSLLSNNSKLDYPCFNLPPDRTCDHPCSYCYGRKGRFVFKTVRNAELERYRWTMNCTAVDKNQWIRVMKAAIEPYTRFRWFGNGDIPNADVAWMIYGVCERLPETKFWLSTKKFNHRDILQTLVEIAKLPNCTVRPSSHPGKQPEEIPGLHGGAAIEWYGDNVIQCPAKGQGGKCANCVACWDDKDKVISYELTGKRE